MEKYKWGFLRETKEAAEKAGIDKDTGLHRTGLEEYLAVIFPDIKEEEWIHDKCIPGLEKRIRPDYRCEKLKLIIEFDGLPHYISPVRIKADHENDLLYKNAGYKVVRIPYFIQLTNEVIEQLFRRKVSEKMFPVEIPSLGVKGRNTPAFCCSAGLKRMAAEFKKFPQQYEVNMKALKEVNDEFLTGASLLLDEYNQKWAK